MSDADSAANKGRDSVTDASDAYLINGVEALEAWYGPSTMGKHPAFIASYLQAAGAIHAGELVAEALDRFTEAINRLSHAQPRAS